MKRTAKKAAIWAVSIIGTVIAGFLGLALIGTLIDFPDVEEPPATVTEPSVTPEPTQQAKAKPKAEPKAEKPEPKPEPAADTRANELENMILLTAGYDTFTDALIDNPLTWEGYVTQIRTDGQNAYVTLQLTKADGIDEIADLAATSLSASAYGIDGLKWVIVEDATGTVAAQKQVFGA